MVPAKDAKSSKTPRDVSATQLPAEAIAASVGKSNTAFDLQAGIIFGGNGEAKVHKFLDYTK